MKRSEKMYCTKRLFDRDFLYGVFPRAGYVKDAEAFLQNPDETNPGESDADDETFCDPENDGRWCR